MRSKLLPVLSALVFSCLGRGLGRPRRRPAQGEDHLPGPRVGGLSQPVRLVPQPRQAEGGPEPRQLRLGDARGRLGQGDRAGRCREQHALPGGLAQGRAQDAAQLAQDPRRRDRADPQVDRRGCARKLGQRGDGQGQAEVRVQARPRGAGQAGRHAGDAREPDDRAVRSPGQAQRGRGDGREPLGALGRGRRPQASAALSNDRSPPGRRPALSRGDDLRPQVQPQRRPALGRRRPRRSVRDRRRLGRQEGEPRLRGRQGVRRRSWRPTSAPTTARSLSGGPEQGRPDLQHGRRIAGARDAQAHRVDHGRRVQPGRRACSRPATATTA